MGVLCPQCHVFFANKWGLKVHLRTCAEHIEPRLVQDKSFHHPPQTEGTRHLPRGFPLATDWDVEGSSEQLEPTVRRHRDNVIVRNELEYWKRLEGNAAPSTEDEVVPPSSDTIANDPLSCHVDADGEVPSEQLFSVSNATPEEIVAASREMIYTFAEKVGRTSVDRFLRLVTSPQWAQLVTGQPVLELEAPRLPTSVGEAERELHMSADQPGFENYVASSGFEARSVYKDDATSIAPGMPPRSPSSLKLQVYVRSPVDTLRKLLEKASVKKRNFFFDPVELTDRNGERMVSHPMSGRVAHEALPRVRQAISSHPSPEVRWSPESFVALIQVYSDKSAMSLKSSAFTFYPLHVCCLGFSSEDKDAAIRRGDTVVAYLPVDPSWSSSDQQRGKFGMDGEPISGSTQASGSHLQSTEAARRCGAGNVGEVLPRPPETREILAKALEEALRELKEVAEKGISFRDADGVQRKAHLVLASYVGDTPEVSTVACTKNNRCARCDVPVSEMGTPGVTGEARTSRTTEQALFVSTFHDTSRRDHRASLSQDLIDSSFTDLIAEREDRGSLLEIRKNFDAIVSGGLTSCRPYFLDWPFADVHESLDMYRVLRCDLMHTFPLGVLKNLVVLVTKRLRSTSLRTPVFRDAKGRPRTYLYARKRILLAANAYLKKVDAESPAVNFRVDFSKGHSRGKLDGLFVDQGIAAMLEAKDMKNLQQVLPFAAAVIDRLCGDATSRQSSPAALGARDPTGDGDRAPLTEVFVKYNDLLCQLAGCSKEAVGIRESDVRALQSSTSRFKDTAIRVFGDFQASSFCYPKFHSLEHIVQDILDLGYPAHYSADAFEASHVRFKAINRTTSRRKGTTLAETTAKMVSLEDKLSRTGRASISFRRDPHALRNNPRNLRNTRPSMVDYLVTGNKAPPVDLSNTADVQWSNRHGSEIPCPSDDQTRDLVRKRNESSVEIPAPNRLSRKRTRSDIISEMTPKQAAVATDSCCLGSSRGVGLPFNEAADSIRAISQERPKDSEAVLSAADLSGGKLFVASLGGYALAKKALDIVEQHAMEGSESATRHTIRNSIRLHMVKSAYAAGFPTPTVHDQDGDNACLYSDGARILQKIVAALSYSHSSVPRQESVMVETAEESTSGSSGGMKVWFAKVLVFMHTTVKYGLRKEELEQAVVRYYEIVPREEFDAVDEALGCIRLKWSMDANGDPWIDVIPASSIRGRVHVVPGDKPMFEKVQSQLAPGDESDDDDEEGEDEASFLDSHDWKERRFYVNRFKVNSSEMRYATQDISSSKCLDEEDNSD